MNCVYIYERVIKMIDYQYIESVISNQIINETTTYNNSLISLVTKACKKLNYYTDSEIKQILLGTYLMDIGLHLNQGLLLDYEDHPVKGYTIVQGLQNADIVKDIVLLHHENDAGRGFPYGLTHDEIPEHVRIVSICKDYIQYRYNEKLMYNEIISKLSSLYDNELVEHLSQLVFK